MTQETLTVRMNRSNASIPWGFTLRASGADVVVNTVEKDGLADKAAIAPNDKVVEFADCKQSLVTLSRANEILKQPKLELRFILSRYITTHPSLPWNLTDQENKIVVDQINPQTFKPIHNSYKSTKTYTETTKSSEGTVGSLPKPIALGYGPAPFKSPTSATAYDEHIISDQNSFQNQQYTTSSSYLKKTTVGNSGYTPSSFTNIDSHNAEVNYSVNNNTTGNTSTANEVHQSTENSNKSANVKTVYSVPIQKTPAKVYTPTPVTVNHTNSIMQKQYQYHPGPRPFAHSSHRTVRKLSPTASVQYLQSKPSSASYAYETPVEEYLRKTGGLFGTDPHLTKGAPYFSSETRRAIAEEEGGFGRASSPAQSESFKRISRAVGTPVS